MNKEKVQPNSLFDCVIIQNGRKMKDSRNEGFKDSRIFET